MITDKETETLGELLDGYGFGLPTVELKAILEAYEQSKWVKFIDWDATKLPPSHRSEEGSIDCLVVTQYGDMFKAYFDYVMQKWWDCKEEKPVYDTIIAWQPLPEFKEIE